MGKSLVIKGADFSANGMKVDVLLGTLTKSNTSSVLNTPFKVSDILALHPSGNSIKILLGTNDATADAQIQGKQVKYIKTTNPYAEYATKVWGKEVTLNVSELTSNAIICQQTDVSSFANVDVWMKVYE